MMEDITPGHIPPLPEPPDIMERATGEPCTVCHEPVLHMQLRSGVRDRQGVYYEGPYLCVLHALSPEEALHAVMTHALPVIDTTAIDEHGRMKPRT